MITPERIAEIKVLLEQWEQSKDTSDYLGLALLMGDLVKSIPDLLDALEQAESNLITAKADRDHYKHLHEDHSEDAVRIEQANVRYWKAQAEQERERVLRDLLREVLGSEADAPDCSQDIIQTLDDARWFDRARAALQETES